MKRMWWSKSPKNLDRNSEIVLIGDSWILDLFQLQFKKRNVEVTVIRVGNDRSPEFIPICVGNGEVGENAWRIFGASLAEKLWALSLRNSENARRLMPQLTPLKEFWFARTDREQELWEATARRDARTSLLSGEVLKQGGTEFRSVLSEPMLLTKGASFAKGLSQERCDGPLSIREESSFHYSVEFQQNGNSKRLSASVVLVLSEWIALQQFASLRDRFIPVTLSSFTFPARKTPDCAMAVFNSGADFVFIHDGQVNAGSYRNLYEDKGVGRLDHADKITQKSVVKLLLELGWIEKEEPSAGHLSYEAVTCDGLPLVGSLAEHPGVYVVGGFAARTGNFIFEVSEALANSILNGIPSDLDIFSTRRFI
jgi:hypothetical protein